MSTTKPSALAIRLRLIADEMEQLGADIDYYGGFSEWHKHGREMIGAAIIARQWSEEIEAESCKS